MTASKLVVVRLFCRLWPATTHSLDKDTLMKRSATNALAIVILCTLSFSAGWLLQPEQKPATAQNDTPGFLLLQETETLLQTHYYTELPDGVQMEYAAIRGYLSALNDRYTFFIDPPVAQSESQALAGRYGGIGVDVNRNEQGQLVLFPFPDSPAERAGVRPGDWLLDINLGELVAGEQLDLIRQQLRGQIVEGDNNGVTITILTPGETESRTLFIAFEEIITPTVTWRVLAEDPQIGYIHIRSFTARLPQEFQAAVEGLRAADITALILDLRGNAGGLLQESLDLTGEFLDGGVILREESRRGEILSEDAPGGAVLDWPVYLLVNGGTASASEIVAGALQDYGRAVLVGQQTFGKGSVQFIFALADGSSIHMTASVWRTPLGRPIEGVGIAPDIPMIPDMNGRDVELGEAIRRIQQARPVE
jgi:carboxyl-terminal processing protease